MAKEEKPVEGGEAPKKGKKLLIIIIVLLLVVLGGGGAAAFFLLKSNDHDEDAEEVVEKAKPKKKKKADAGHPVFMALDPPFTVNLKGGEQYIQVAISLQIEELPQAEAIKPYQPKLRSDINNILTSRTAEELLTVEGKQKLAADIRTAINEVVDPPAKGQTAESPVLEVLFPAFIIQ